MHMSRRTWSEILHRRAYRQHFLTTLSRDISAIGTSRCKMRRRNKTSIFHQNDPNALECWPPASVPRHQVPLLGLLYRRLLYQVFFTLHRSCDLIVNLPRISRQGLAVVDRLANSLPSEISPLAPTSLSMRCSVDTPENQFMQPSGMNECQGRKPGLASLSA